MEIFTKFSVTQGHILDKRIKGDKQIAYFNLSLKNIHLQLIIHFGKVWFPYC